METIFALDSSLSLYLRVTHMSAGFYSSLSSGEAAAASVLQAILGPSSSIAYTDNTATSRVTEAIEKATSSAASVSIKTTDINTHICAKDIEVNNVMSEKL